MTRRGALAIIPARAGSTRLPGKNARPMAGRPMVAWTIEAALAAETLDQIVVSTDDPAVAAVAADMGLPPPFVRPAELSGPDASVMDAVAHALAHLGGDWDEVVLLQPTSPLRTAADVDRVVQRFRAARAPAAISTSPLPKPVAFYGRTEHGRLTEGPLDLDALRIVNGAVYVGRPEVILPARTFRVEGCLAVDLPPDRGWDVDVAAEFAACEALLLARMG